jgi:predicted nucleic-acid-binding protein
VAIPGTPGLAPYEAAQENGTIALLPSGEIRLYNRIAYQVSLTRAALDYWRESLQAVNAFDNRFNHSSDDFSIFEIERVPALDGLSSTELAEYQALIGTLINATDVVIERMRLIATECRAVLNGAHDESDLIKIVTSMLSSGSKLRNSPALGK